LSVLGCLRLFAQLLRQRQPGRVHSEVPILTTGITEEAMVGTIGKGGCKLELANQGTSRSRASDASRSRLSVLGCLRLFAQLLRQRQPGHVHSEVPILTTTITEEAMVGTIGKGGCKLELANQNGNITIESSEASRCRLSVVCGSSRNGTENRQPITDNHVPTNVRQKVRR
jgi:hypothetical protein